MRGLLGDAVGELLSRKVLFLFGFVTLVMILAVFVTGEIGVDIKVQGGEDFEVEQLIGPLGPWIAQVFSKVMTIFVFLAVLATVGLIPVSLEKGRAEFYLSRPVSRSRLLFGKLFSIWLVYGTVIIVCGLIIYGFTSVIHGVLDGKIVYLFLVYWLNFLIWLSIVGLAGILFGSAAWSMMAAFVVWIAQWLLSYHEGISQIVRSKLVNNLIEVLYYAVPKTGEIGDIAVSLSIGRTVDSWMPLWSSLLFAAVMLYLAAWVFKRRDY